MEFTGRVTRVIEEGWQELEGEQEADRVFREGWTEKRKLVHQVLAAAKRPLEAGRLGGAFAQQENGCNLLHAEVAPHSERESGTQLQFCMDRQSRRIVCRTKPAQLMEEESFTLEALTTDTVEQKVLGFVKALMARRMEREKSKQS